MSEKIWFRVLISVFLLVALIGAGLWVYNMGMMQGATVNIDGELPTAFADRYLPQYGTMAPYAHGGLRMFSPLRFIGGFFFLLFIIAMFRMVIFGPRRYAHFHGRHCGSWREWNHENVPPMVKEWHRKMHEQESPKSED
jgi:hypothetical protein